MDIGRFSVEAGDKEEAEATEGARAWDEAKAKKKIEIARVNAGVSEKAEA